MVKVNATAGIYSATYSGVSILFLLLLFPMPAEFCLLWTTPIPSLGSLWLGLGFEECSVLALL